MAMGLLLGVVLLAAPAGAGVAPIARQVFETSDDDPRQALALGERELAKAVQAQDDATQFWLYLALEDAATSIDDEVAGQRYLQLAQLALNRMPRAGDDEQLWIEVARLDAELSQSAAQQAELRRRLRTFQSRVRATHDDELLISYLVMEYTLSGNLHDYDQAWAAAEEIERVAKKIGWTGQVAVALGDLAFLVTKVNPKGDTPMHYLEQALAELAQKPFHYQRGRLEQELGNAYLTRGETAAAREHFANCVKVLREVRNALYLSQCLYDLGRTELQLQHPQQAADDFRSANQLFQASAFGSWMLDQSERGLLQAMRQSKASPAELHVQIARTLRQDGENKTLIRRADLHREVADAYAELHEYAKAYAELKKADDFAAQAQESTIVERTAELQARYDASKRDAENEQLKLQARAAQIQLEAQSVRQQGLWAALAGLMLACLALAYFIRRQLRQRRQLAALASRDELTGQPNRRAIMAYAQAQLRQARMFKLPLTIAMIDLDWFKRVNDTYGHAGGDAVLKAFAQAINTELRGQDRLGRMGGEEWLLVAPGTTCAEMPTVFNRLSQAFAQSLIAGLPQPHGLTFSMGAAEMESEGVGVDQIIELADQRLYRAKQNGRNQACCDGVEATD